MIDQSVMSPAAYVAQQRETVLKNGLGARYGLGVDVKVVQGHRLISHAGGEVGFISENRVFPNDNDAIVVLDNADFSDATTAIADAIQQQLFADSSGVPRARAVYEMLRSGHVDRGAFTANGDFYFTPTVLADYRMSLTLLGEPKHFTQQGASLRGGFTDEDYLLDYGDRKMALVLRAEPGPGGRIEQFTLSPAS